MRVIQLIDSLNAGGAERVAVNIANALTLKIDKSFICTTRLEGSLKEHIDKSVGYIFLNKQAALDFKAIFKLKRFIKEQHISIVHAHASSYFLATTLKLLISDLKIIWHDHYGNSEFLEQRPFRILKICSKKFSHIFCVNQSLAKWDKQHLQCKSVSYLQNFAVKTFTKPITNLFGVDGKRVLCLANLRSQKDHETLLMAFKIVHQQHPNWTLHCVGQDFNDTYSKHFFNLIDEFALQKCVYFYGTKSDVSNIISQCAIGVLSSKSEGLPLALLEYGLGKTPIVATNVGDCKDVIRSNSEGILVKSFDYGALANGIIFYINNEDVRHQVAKQLHDRVINKFSSEAIVNTIVAHYKKA